MLHLDLTKQLKGFAQAACLGQSPALVCPPYTRPEAGLWWGFELKLLNLGSVPSLHGMRGWALPCAVLLGG